MTPLVLVHGFMGGSEQWRAQGDLGTGREMICIDLPGFGRNADLPPIDSIEGIADWVLEYLSREGVHRFHLLGHSMGGMIAQQMVRQVPERVDRLILYGTGPIGALPGRFETIETSLQRARDDGAAATARRIAATWYLSGTDDPDYPVGAAIAERSSLPAILAGLTAMGKWSGVNAIGNITAATLILWRDRDRTYDWSQPEALWRGIPGASLAVLPDCAHAVHAEAPVLFNQIIQRFLSN